VAALANPWVLLVLAGLCEVGWALGLKASDGFTRPGPTLMTLAGALLSFWLLAQAMKSLPVGTAYAVWTGIGAVGTAILAVVLLGEPMGALRALGIGLIVAGIVALRLA
jgi:quaternary ammonium compound-resistance protein SugE